MQHGLCKAKICVSQGGRVRQVSLYGVKSCLGKLMARAISGSHNGGRAYALVVGNRGAELEAGRQISRISTEPTLALVWEL